MNGIFKFFIVSIIFTQLGLASDQDEGQRKPIYSPRNQSASTLNFNWKGTIRCVFSSHIKTKKCDLEFTRDDGKVFSIIQNRKLVNLHCKEHKDLKLNIQGLVRQDFLLNAGILYVKDFKLIKKISHKSKQRVLNITKPN